MAKFEIKDGVAIISEGTKTIPENAFYKCEELTTVVIPESVTSIGNGAFADLASLTSIVIPESVTII